MFETLPGFREFFPEECAVRNHIFRLWRQVAVRFGFTEYDAPVLEPLDLYREKSGDEIVGQLFSFVDRGDREVALRPEMTPSLVRMVGQRANSLKRPIKWFSVGEQYRYERQQRGRLRAFLQFNADILGEAGPEADVELIALLIESLAAFGLNERDFVVRISDRDLWLLYLRGAGLDEEACGTVLQVVDKMEREPEETSIEKLRAVVGQGAADFWSRIRELKKLRSLDEVAAFLSDESAGDIDRAALDDRLANWRVLLAGLEAMGLKDFVEVDLGVVRGLAYYTGFVFEAFDREGAFRALAGGGRYDHLMGRMTRADLPATGFAVGDAVLRELLESRNLIPRLVSAPDVYVVFGGGEPWRQALGDIRLLRQAGYRVEYGLKAAGFGKQFKAAGQSGAPWALVYGEEEAEREAVKLKDMREGAEQVVPRAELLQRLAEIWGAGQPGR